MYARAGGHRFQLSISGWLLLDVIDDQNRRWALARLQFQSELLLQGLLESPDEAGGFRCGQRRTRTRLALIGLLIRSALLPLASSLFYGILPVEPLVISGVSCATVSITLATAYLAARPWTPTVALAMVLGR